MISANTTTRKAPAKQEKQTDVWKLTMTAMLSVLSFILMFFEFSLPIIPSFVKMDLSDLPALLGAFAMGPVSGAAVCLVKNLLHLFITSTGGVGELSNFLLGACFVFPAGLVYHKWKNKKSAFFGAFAGALLMGIDSIASNYYIAYPFFYHIMPEETILAAYQLILPQMESMLECLIIFNAPFTFVKGLFCLTITMAIYKPLSPFLKGAYRKYGPVRQ